MPLSGGKSHGKASKSGLIGLQELINIYKFIKMNLKHQKQTIMKRLTFLLTLLLIPFLINAQNGNTTTGVTVQSYGYLAGTQGNFSTFMGERTGQNNTGTHNTFIGARAGRFNSKGTHNTYIGVNAGGKTNSGTAQYNVFLGVSSGFRITSGDKNTFLGTSTGNNTKTGNGNVYIGYNAGYYGDLSDKLIIDTKTTTTDTNSPLIYGDFAQHYVGIAIDPTQDIVNTNLYGLYVGKGILAEKVRIATPGTTDWSDYVFEADYDLNTIEEVEQFVKENKHLPNVPSAAEVNEKGVDVVEMDATLLRQIEELWLHVIELKKYVTELEAQLEQK